MRTALIHDWLTGMRGGERVLEALCGLYPEADIFTLIHRRGSVSPTIERHSITTSFIQHLPLASRHYRQYLPLFPAAIERFDLEPYDLVVSSSHCAAKAVIAGARARHLSYCHSPMRYAWDQFDAYFGEERKGVLASRFVYRPILERMARWDAATASRVHRFVANSAHVAGRIRRYYNREATIVYPPVDTDFFHPSDVSPGQHFVIVSALVPYKRIDAAIDACARIGARLRIIGDGPDRAHLERRAGPHVEFVGALSDEGVRDEYRRALAVIMPGEEDFGIVPVEAQACGRPVVALGRGGALETVVDNDTGILFDRPDADSLSGALGRLSRTRFDPVRLRAHAQQFARSRHIERMREVIAETVAAPLGNPMVKRYNRLLVGFYVVTDAVLAMWAFVFAYGIRFESGLIPVIHGYPPFEQYLNVLPFIAILTPLAFQLQGVYRLRRGRSRVDDFFAVLIGTILAVVLGVIATLYVGAYYATDEQKARGAYEVSQLVWGLFLVANVTFTYASREAVRELLERRWRAGIGLKRILIAGAGDLGRMVADRMLQHRELGYQVVGFVDDRAGGDHIGYRGLPLLGTLAEVGDIAQRERVDHLYVALPLDEHSKLLDVLEITSREFIDVKVVPDLLQFIALRARLEDLDGLPVINVNDVPLQGFNAWVKRSLDVVFSLTALTLLSIPLVIIAALIKLTSNGPIFYRQERMGLDGKAFTVYKFRSMHDGAEDVTGPIWARDNDPRVTRLGHWLRRLDLDELPQFWNVLRGDMSIVGPRPERPYFVDQFKHRIPQYMLRHKVKAGITGWAQVNGWRGNTSLEKRIEYHLYYIENWSVTLDIKIMWLTLVRGVFQRDAAA